MDRVQIYIFQKREKKYLWTNLNLAKEDYLLYEEDGEKYLAVVIKTFKELQKTLGKFEENGLEDEKIELQDEKKFLIKSKHTDKTDSCVKEQLKRVSKEEFKKHLKNQLRAGRLFNELLKEIENNSLEIKLFDVQCNFLDTKLIIFYTADKRVDFREFVKKIAKKYKKRIEMVQISLSEETIRDGGFGKCGRDLCCVSFLSKPTNGTIKNAKNQDLSLISEKISGRCGKLMCCLQYENDVYTEKKEKMPKIGEKIYVDGLEGEVVNIETLKEIIRVKFFDTSSNEIFFKNYKYEELLKSNE